MVTGRLLAWLCHASHCFHCFHYHLFSLCIIYIYLIYLFTYLYAYIIMITLLITFIIYLFISCHFFSVRPPGSPEGRGWDGMGIHLIVRGIPHLHDVRQGDSAHHSTTTPPLHSRATPPPLHCHHCHCHSITPSIQEGRGGRRDSISPLITV